MPPASHFTIGRRAVAVLVALAAIACVVALFGEWHVVRGLEIVDPDAVFAAMYLGPDYDISAEARGSLMDQGIGESVSVCTGSIHLGVEAPFVTGAVAVAAIIAAAWPARRSAWWPALTTALLAVVFAGFVEDRSFLRHILYDQGPDRMPARVFGAAELVVVCAAAVLLMLALLERRSASRSAAAGERREPR